VQTYWCRKHAVGHKFWHQVVWHKLTWHTQVKEAAAYVGAQSCCDLTQHFNFAGWLPRQYSFAYSTERESFGEHGSHNSAGSELSLCSHVQAVLHVTNLVPHVGETELTTFFSQLGSVAFATLLPSAGTALVEMSTIQDSEKVIAFGQTQPVSSSAFCAFKQTKCSVLRVLLLVRCLSAELGKIDKQRPHLPHRLALHAQEHDTAIQHSLAFKSWHHVSCTHSFLALVDGLGPAEHWSQLQPQQLDQPQCSPASDTQRTSDGTFIRWCPTSCCPQ